LSSLAKTTITGMNKRKSNNEGTRGGWGRNEPYRKSGKGKGMEAIRKTKESRESWSLKLCTLISLILIYLKCYDLGSWSKEISTLRALIWKSRIQICSSLSLWIEREIFIHDDISTHEV
jgi:hypothetical protein